MPAYLELSGIRGDQFLRAISLLHPGTPPTPLTTGEGNTLQATYTTIEMQVRSTAQNSTTLLSLTSAAGELSIQSAYPQPDGTTAPSLVINIDPTKTQTLISGVYDIQFSGVGVGPFTWLAGTFTLAQDVTRAAG